MAMIVLHIYKGYGGLLYPPAIWVMELHGIIFLFIVQMIRIYYGLASNRQESSKMTCVFLFLTSFTLLPILHIASFSTYVLEVEIFMSIVIAAFCVIEIVLSTFALIMFKSQNL